MFTPPSKAGFGVSGAHGSPLVAARDTVRLLIEAFEGGVRVFDTAPSYGAGEAERRLGAAVSALGRERVFITTKAGLFSSGLSGRRRNFSPDAVEASVLASLDRLGVAGVDMLFLHGAGVHELTPPSPIPGLMRSWRPYIRFWTKQKPQGLIGPAWRVRPSSPSKPPATPRRVCAFHAGARIFLGWRERRGRA
jgi:diketogulonate reductase-like aldo/keto reductase